MTEAVISGFDLTTNAVRAWAEVGYVCYCVDTQHPRGETREGNIIRVGADMLDWLPPRGLRVAASFWAAPCTDVAVSGARWFRDKGLGRLIRALELFKRSVDLAELIGAPYAIENPVSTVSKYWRPPDHSFDPYQYSGYEGGADDWYTKKTCLWTGNGFVMPEPKFDTQRLASDPPDARIHLASPGPDRANFRSAAPAGFWRAVFEANAVAALA